MTYTLIRNGTLIDGTGAPPVGHAAVLLRDNRIHAVGTADTIPVPDDTITELDTAGGYILPGFIDAHVHLTTEGASVEKLLSTPFSLHFYQMVGRLRRTIEAGVTSVRDAAGADLGVKQAVETGLVVGPRLQIAITMLSPTSGHGDGWLPSGIELRLPPYPGRPHGRCNGVEEVRAKVREVLRAGADVVKVATTGGVYSPTTQPTHTKFAPEELAVIAQEAAFCDGTKVMAHAHGAEGIKNAVRAGFHSIEHGTYIDDEAFELMLDRGTFLVPTLAVHLATLEAAESAEKPAEWAIRKGREITDIHRENIARAYRAGVRIAMGTDTAIARHGTNLRELGLMCDIGMTPMEAIVATTKTAAECLGWEDSVGTLEAGKLADIVITKTDPLADIRSLEQVENIAVVIKDGQIIKDRRDNADQSANTNTGTNRELRCGDLVLDTNLHSITRGATQVRLTPQEYRILHHLMTNRGHVLSSSAIAEHVWSEVPDKEGLVKVLVHRLRQKLEPNPAVPIYLHTVPGVGYRLEPI